jgi:hypothetical protein
MRLGELGWLLCLAGLPWSYFLVRLVTPLSLLNILQANTWWMQCWVLSLVGIHVTSKRLLGMLPAGLWWVVLWATGLSVWMLTVQATPGQPYSSGLLLGIGHLWIVGLALLVMSTWSKTFLSTLATALFWSGIGLICYGVLQMLNLDQFFSPVTIAGEINPQTRTDWLVGMIGNPTHFACQLAIWLPFAWLQSGWKKLWMLPALMLMVCANSSIALATVCGLGWLMLWHHHRLWAGLLAGVGSLLLLVVRCEGLSWLNPHGRWETWQAWWPMIQQRPILGSGLGFVQHISQQLPATHPLAGWKQLHNEYYQLWMELGLLGLALVGWAGWQLWQRRTQTAWSPLRQAYGQAFVACCLTATLNFSWHLWQLGGWGLVGLAGWLALTEPEVAT